MDIVSHTQLVSNASGRPEPHRANGTEPYVTFVEPGTERRSSPYTVEGYLANIGDFAAGAVRVRGWRRPVAKLIVLALLLPVLVTVIQRLWTLFWLLLGH